MDRDIKDGEFVLQAKHLRIADVASRDSVVEAQEICIRTGDRIAIMGPSGSGKTVFVLALLGLLKRLAPRLDVEGQIVWGHQINTNGFGVGYVPQGGSGFLNPYLTIGEQIKQCTQSARNSEPLAKRRSLKEAAFTILCNLGFEFPDAVWKAYPHQLSGGMQQRIALVIAILVNPRLLILDEPTSSLDGLQRKLAYNQINQIAQNHHTAVLLMTHNNAEARALAKDIIHISSGKFGPRVPLSFGERIKPERFLITGVPNEKTPQTSKISKEPTLKVQDICANPSLGIETKGLINFQLRNVSFRLDRGERLGVFGVSGSGKTTLVRVLAGLIPVTNGTVAILNYDINQIPASQLRQLRARFQVCLQSSDQSLDPFMTVRELLDAPAKIHGFEPMAERAIEDFLFSVELPANVLARRANELSFGQRQRVAIGRLLFSFPTVDLLVLDEPLSGLDLPLYRKMVKLLQSRFANKAVIVTSHDHSLLDEVSTKLMALHDGSVTAVCDERPWKWDNQFACELWEAGLRYHD